MKVKKLTKQQYVEMLRSMGQSPDEIAKNVAWQERKCQYMSAEELAHWHSAETEGPRTRESGIPVASRSVSELWARSNERLRGVQMKESTAIQDNTSAATC